MNNVLALQMLAADTGGGAEAVGDDSGEGGQEMAGSNLSTLTCEDSSNLSLLLC